jgi:hypothetical protein
MKGDYDKLVEERSFDFVVDGCEGVFLWLIL